MEHLLSRTSYLLSAVIATLGCITLSGCATTLGIVLGVLTYRLNKRHRARIEAEQHERTQLLRERVRLLQKLAEGSTGARVMLLHDERELTDD
ncbi:hypothetical protein I6H07_15965 [Hafnia alvei]|uniref:hypothetical protein n=1 Tax=Hafnia alvei TaxID=569 RepID=UPI000B707E8C|nr:hypothetical protein [Hafnia alvei]MBI0277275.1 hypothetical protein [Hafnia alvei]PNK97563.1 hypothetical protein CEQ28_008145 [Hafnia alvei]